MATYNTRVELHNLGSADHRATYEELHVAMERFGFTRTIGGDNGKTYRLPHAEYGKVTGDPIGTVQALAKRAADSVHAPNGVITWMYSQANWEGLDPL